MKPPNILQAKSTFTYPLCHADSSPGDLPVRTERNNPFSMATLRRHIALTWPVLCPDVLAVCGITYNTVVLAARGASLGT